MTVVKFLVLLLFALPTTLLAIPTAEILADLSTKEAGAVEEAKRSVTIDAAFGYPIVDLERIFLEDFLLLSHQSENVIFAIVTMLVRNRQGSFNKTMVEKLPNYIFMMLPRAEKEKWYVVLSQFPRHVTIELFVFQTSSWELNDFSLRGLRAFFSKIRLQALHAGIRDSILSWYKKEPRKQAITALFLELDLTAAACNLEGFNTELAGCLFFGVGVAAGAVTSAVTLALTHFFSPSTDLFPLAFLGAAPGFAIGNWGTQFRWMRGIHRELEEFLLYVELYVLGPLTEFRGPMPPELFKAIGNFAEQLEALRKREKLNRTEKALLIPIYRSIIKLAESARAHESEALESTAAIALERLTILTDKVRRQLPWGAYCRLLLE